jgi:phosphatidylserine decarboxylase
MRNFILIGIILFGIMSCNNEQGTTTQTTTESIPNDEMTFHYGNIDEYRIQEIDGCEYIVINGKSNSEPALTHKGNCKYCLERSKQQQTETY